MEIQTPEALKDDPIDHRVAVHDSHHFEVKLDYSIDKDRKKNRYEVDSYFFVPRSLGINQHTYPREQFYSDVQAYIRFKTPTIPLRTIADRSEALSPLNHIYRLLDDLAGRRDREAEKRLSHELKMLGCVARARLRDRARELRDRVTRLRGKARARAVLVSDLGRSWMTFLADVEQFARSWRSIRHEITDGQLTLSIREAYQFVDEYLSIELESKLTSLLNDLAFDEALGDALAEMRERTTRMLLEERDYREGAGYDAVIREGDERQNEHYVWRRGMLKKFVMSVLWLEIAKEKHGAGAQHLGAAIAAGAAMAIALLATVLHSRYVLSTSGFVIAGTIVYILKDRIKEWLKGFLSASFRRLLSDYSEEIRDPSTGRELGRCRESFTWVADKDVPEDVLALRQLGAAASIEWQAKPEIVFRYHKDVTLNGRAIVERLHLEDYDLNDIIRFGIQQFLVRADDPVDYVATYDASAGTVARRPFPKVYHLNVVFVIRALSGRAMAKRIRVVFDKGGIRRLEQVA